MQGCVLASLKQDKGAHLWYIGGGGDDFMIYLVKLKIREDTC
jgi:hypothetical protein